MHQKIFAVIAMCLAHIFTLTSVASAGEPARIALLIGNQNYNDAVGALKFPYQDVDAMGASLAQLRFDVTVIKDASYSKMAEAISRHAARVHGAGAGAISFFYYSGHGAANASTRNNYLIPVDVARADTNDVWFQSFEQSAIIDQLNRHAPDAIHIVVFDACRDELQLASTGKKALSVDKGFAPVNEVQGMLIAYATAAKGTAADTGAFARILAQEITKPGVEALAMFRAVQLRAKREMNQEPWMSLPYLPETYLAGRTDTDAQIQKLRHQTDLAFFSSIKDSSKPAILRTYLDRFPDGDYASLVRSLIAEAEIEQSQREEQARKEKEAAQANATRELAEARRVAAESNLAAAKHAKELEVARAAIEVEREKAAAAQAAQLKAEQEAKEAKLLAEKTAAVRIDRAQKAESQIALADPQEAAGSGAPESPNTADNESAFALPMQKELARLRCYNGELDGVWGSRSTEALRQVASSENLRLHDPHVSSKNLEILKALISASCRSTPSSKPWRPSAETKPSERVSQQTPSSPGRASTSGIHSVCYQRAQRYCSNLDNSSAIGFQACMTQAKKGCRDQ